MKVLYFNLSNGECIPAFTVLPAYKATITGSRIHTIEACFSVSNIISNDYEWFQKQVERENKSWSEKHPHLMKSLKRLALKESLKHPFRYSNFEQASHRFPYVLVWSKDKRYTAAYFKGKDEV